MELYHLLLLFSVFALVLATETDKYAFLMPNVTPNKDELYLCTPIKVDPLHSYYIVGFEPNATMHTAHHMLLYGCTAPGTDKPVWNCGEMQRTANSVDDGPSGSPCKAGSQIIYAWARDAPMLTLPNDVGFKVGGDSPIQYLVLQVHYMHKFPAETSDNSGVFLHYTKTPMSKQAGVLLLGTSGGIAPYKLEHMETSCTIKEDKVIHPFAYRTHTHSLGKVVSGYHVRVDEKGVDAWSLLGKRDPLTPQMFYPIEDPSPILPGDILAARCTMYNNKSSWTMIGSTNNDEMCNFYLMYYVDNDEPLDTKYCFSRGPPATYWKLQQPSFQHIPEEDASTL